MIDSSEEARLIRSSCLLSPHWRMNASKTSHAFFSTSRERGKYLHERSFPLFPTSSHRVYQKHFLNPHFEACKRRSRRNTDPNKSRRKHHRIPTPSAPVRLCTDRRAKESCIYPEVSLSTALPRMQENAICTPHAPFQKSLQMHASNAPATHARDPMVTHRAGPSRKRTLIASSCHPHSHRPILNQKRKSSSPPHPPPSSPPDTPGTPSSAARSTPNRA